MSRKQRHEGSELEQQQGQAVISKALTASTACVLVSIWDDPGELQPVRTPGVQETAAFSSTAQGLRRGWR